VIIAISTLTLLKEEQGTATPLLLRNTTPIKSVEIFTPETAPLPLRLEKSGTIQSQEIITISPQISGRLISTNVKIGDLVHEGTLLGELGNSLNTDILLAQNQAATKSLELSKKTKQLTQKSVEIQTKSAEIGLRTAQIAYETAMKNRAQTEQIFLTQAQSSLLDQDNAYNSLKAGKNTYYDFLDSIDDLEDNIKDLDKEITDLNKQLQSAPPEEITIIESVIKELKQQKSTIKEQLKTLEQQEDQMQLNLDTARNLATKSDLGITLQYQTFHNQVLQLDTGVANAKAQLDLAKNQLESAKLNSSLQITQIEGQIIQSQLNKETGDLTMQQTKLIAPITGTISNIYFENETLINPGQAVFEITKTDHVAAEIFINIDELNLVNIGTPATITVNNQTYDGKIIGISPTPDPQSKKISVKIGFNDTLAQSAITPGSFASVNITPETNNTIWIPLNAVSIKNNDQSVKILTPASTIAIQSVTTGRIINEYIEILSGIDKSTPVVISVNLFLEEGERVTANNE
jgi:RND family efflux transporter MFP subunit